MKKFIIMVMTLLPMGMVAQEQKIALVRHQEVFAIMPEVTPAENELAALQQQYDNHMKSMEEEYNRKYQDLMTQQDSLPENIYKIRVQEIQELIQRIENFQQTARQELTRKESELLAPIYEKLQKAIEQVGEENGYAMILNPQVTLYIGKAAIDATDKVKAKLGIQ